MKLVPLTQGKLAQVDDADFGTVAKFKWRAERKNSGQFHACRTIRLPGGKRQTRYLHQELLPGHSGIDHRDGDGLNNCRYNLRPATHQQNMRGFQPKRRGTTSNFRGVSWNANAKKWEARIQVKGARLHLGIFHQEEQAARAYDRAVRRHYGEFASPNFSE